MAQWRHSIRKSDMISYWHLTYFVTDFGKILYRLRPHNFVEHCRISWKSARERPYYLQAWLAFGLILYPVRPICVKFGTAHVQKMHGAFMDLVEICTVRSYGVHCAKMYCVVQGLCWQNTAAGRYTDTAGQVSSSSVNHPGNRVDQEVHRAPNPLRATLQRQIASFPPWYT